MQMRLRLASKRCCFDCQHVRTKAGTLIIDSVIASATASSTAETRSNLTTLFSQSAFLIYFQFNCHWLWAFFNSVLIRMLRGLVFSGKKKFLISTFRRSCALRMAWRMSFVSEKRHTRCHYWQFSFLLAFWLNFIPRPASVRSLRWWVHTHTPRHHHRLFFSTTNIPAFVLPNLCLCVCVCVWSLNLSVKTPVTLRP